MQNGSLLLSISHECPAEVRKTWKEVDMRFIAVATDYDNTLAEGGRVARETWDAIERLHASGRHVILVTGRHLDDLRRVCDRLDQFSRVVAENGGVLFDPATEEQRLLGPPPVPAFVDAMRRRGVNHLGVGAVIVDTVKPHEVEALEAIRELGLDLHIVFNGDAVMILPPGMTKASGLAAALDELGFSPRNVVAIGDAENDHPLLEYGEVAVAVANALPALKAKADFVTLGEHGRGVIELVGHILADDLAGLPRLGAKRAILLGREAGREPEVEVRLAPYGTVCLLAGTSGGGKSTVATSLLERIAEAGYQFCVIDPEGDYGSFDNVQVRGDADHLPSTDEVLQVLRRPDQSVIVNLMRVALDERARFCASLLARLQEMRVETGRPHWLMFDEAHHLFPASADVADLALPRRLETALAITVHPHHVSPALLSQVDTLLVVGAAPQETVQSFAQAAGRPAPDAHDVSLRGGEALFCRFDSDAGTPRVVTIEPGHLEHRRHVRRYAEGLLIPERSFYFRGPENRLNLRAHNLVLFLEIGDGVDAETWLFHLRRGDYSRWFEDVIGDRGLADETRAIESNCADDTDAGTARAKVRAAVERRYTQPDNPCLPVSAA
ncbi:HAD hydrolase family protein [Paraburkholderia sp. CI3]|uniref:HAD hydrolase family protein n=1 Tax=Paraburkholderia sp. CI3 TaxID=2991060 RepID=UPI003D26388A